MLQAKFGDDPLIATGWIPQKPSNKKEYLLWRKVVTLYRYLETKTALDVKEYDFLTNFHLYKSPARKYN